MRFVKLGLALSMMLTAATLTQAQPVPGGDDPGGEQGGARGGTQSSAPAGMTTITAEQLAQAFGAAGFEARVIQSDNGHKMVLATLWPGKNIIAGATLELCENGPCKIYRLAVVIPKARVKPSWPNSWNSRFFMVRTFLDETGTLTFQWDVPMLSGLTPNYIIQTIQVFKAIVDESSKFKG